MSNNFKIQGHRGARGLLPENTIESCIEAIKCGVDGLEIDVVVSKDGQVVVSHEPWMSPLFCSCPDGKALPRIGTEGVLLKNLTYDEIRHFDCGSRGNPRFESQKAISTYKPTLYELIKSVNEYCLVNKSPVPFFNIEVKSDPKWYRKYVPVPSVFIERLKYPLSILNKNAFYISSFDPNFLRVFKSKIPRIPLAFLTENKMSLEQNLRHLGFLPDIYSPYYHHITAKMVTQAHRKGIKIMTWTVNEVREAERLKRMGVDGVITDYPNLIF
jgi:glycerophosphoryl diester phosphodiesterase